MDKTSSNRTVLKKCLEGFDLGKLASDSGWSPSSRKVSALNWCLSLCMASSCKAPSLRMAAHFMGMITLLSVSKQALHKRLHKGGAKLMKKALEASIAAKSHCSNRLQLGGFARVLIQDSTSNLLPKSLEKDYPGSKNHCSSSAILKIQAIYDMLSNQFVEFALSPFTRNDQAAALDILEFIGKGDLVLRDLGYFTLESMRRIGEEQAYFLSRYKNGVYLYSPDGGDRVDLIALLRRNGKLDMNVLAGTDARLPLRLMAIPLTEEVANRRRQKAKSNRDSRSKPSKESLELLGWQIMLTNSDQEQLPVDKAYEIYSMRWRIETIFKAWKSGLGIDEMASHTSKEMLETMIYATLLRITLIHSVLIPWLEARDPVRKVSICKLMDLISASVPYMGDSIEENENLLENLSKHCRYDKRKRNNTLEKWDLLVSAMENLS